jgi:septum formation protein
LALLSGRSHRVYTGVALRTADFQPATAVSSSSSDREQATSRLEAGGPWCRTRLVETRVAFKVLSKREIDAYIASNEWRGKAGGYAIQGLAARYVTSIIGSYSAIVGLPLFETANLLESAAT